MRFRSSAGRLACCFVSSLLFVLGCASNPGPQKNVGPAPGQSSLKLAILAYGFFNSEDPDAFAPESVDYDGVDIEDAHQSIAAKARTMPWGVPIEVLSFEDTSRLFQGRELEDQTAIQKRLMAALDVLDLGVQEGKVPPEKLLALKAPIVLPPDWGPGDRVLAIVGLETLPRPDGRDLRSVLGCFWFSGDASYLASVSVQYDPEKFKTENLTAGATDVCLGKVQVRR